MKKIPERVKDMLDSEDIEMAQLGANLMKEYVPKNKWERVLEMFKYGKEEAELGIYKIKWDWEIKGDDIILTEYSVPGISGPLYTWKFVIQDYSNDTQQNKQLNSGKSKGYVGKPRPGNGKPRRSGPPRIRKK